MRISLLIIAFFFSFTLFSQTTYTFNGNGNWSDENNWAGKSIPPKVLPAGSQIIINPSGECILDIQQNIAKNAVFTVVLGKKFTVSGILDVNKGIESVRIGTQTWMVKNLDVATYRNADSIIYGTNNFTKDGNWFYYDNSPANGAIYGKLYPWRVVDDPRGLAPEGWYVPSEGEWSILQNYVQNTNELKEAGTDHWVSPNDGSNASGFTALPGGWLEMSDYGSGPFFNLKNQGAWWSSSSSDAAYSYSRRLYETSFISYIFSRLSAMSVRCIKNETPIVTSNQVCAITSNAAQSGGTVNSCCNLPVTARGVCWSLKPGATINDNRTNDGTGSGFFTSQLNGLKEGTTYYINTYASNNLATTYGNETSFTTDSTFKDPRDQQVYPLKKIGTLVWMKKNLNYAAPNSICYNNNNSNCELYGRLYDWKSLKSVAPPGWHVPVKEEVDSLGKYQVGEQNNMKDLCGWSASNPWILVKPGVPSIFSALPSGGRYYDPNNQTYGFGGVGEYGSFWTISETLSDTSNGIAYSLSNSSDYFQVEPSLKKGLISVRCLRDYSPVLSTSKLCSITTNSANTGGTAFGVSGFLSKGLCWSTHANPTVADSKTNAGTLPGSFSDTIKGLNPGTTYHLRTYATTAAGTFYGNEKTFSTDSSFKDPRDGQVYTFRHIGSQVWMTKNLNYAAAGSKCMEDYSGYCDTYGRMYDWNTAITAAPPGWHLPTYDEWITMLNSIDDPSTASGIKEPCSWPETYGPFTNSSGFSALPGGSIWSDGTVLNFGSETRFWTSTEEDVLAQVATIGYGSGVGFFSFEKTCKNYIRCVRN